MDEFRIVGHEYEKIRSRKKRYYRYIKAMSESFGTLYLVSLTFTDEVLNSTNEETRKAYVRRWLNSTAVDYFACIDYGKENEREHYHAICVFDKNLETFKAKRRTYYKLPEENAWEHGFYSIRKIADNEKDRRKAVYYAFKASEYAFKNADINTNAKPFHKRGVEHWITIDDTSELPF
jgi:hypothetical protein